MKHTTLILTLGLIALAVSVSCLSNRARDEGLLPAAQQAWPGVQADVQRGIADAVEDGELQSSAELDLKVGAIDKALADGDRNALRITDWPSLVPYGERGIQDRIDDGEMSPMVAESLRERLRNFGAALQMLEDPYVFMAPSPEKEHWLPNGYGRTKSAEFAAIAAEKCN